MLADRTTTPEACIFGVWAGYGGEFAATWSATSLRLPQREYVLRAGPLRAAVQVGQWPTADWFLPQSPNLMWPADRAWFVATEIDFDSTIVAGSAELIEAIIRDRVLTPGR